MAVMAQNAEETSGHSSILEKTEVRTERADTTDLGMEEQERLLQMPSLVRKLEEELARERRRSAEKDKQLAHMQTHVSVLEKRLAFVEECLEEQTRRVRPEGDDAESKVVLDLQQQLVDELSKRKEAQYNLISKAQELCDVQPQLAECHQTIQELRRELQVAQETLPRAAPGREHPGNRTPVPRSSPMKGSNSPQVPIADFRFTRIDIQAQGEEGGLSSPRFGDLDECTEGEARSPVTGARRGSPEPLRMLSSPIRQATPHQVMRMTSGCRTPARMHAESSPTTQAPAQLIFTAAIHTSPDVRAVQQQTPVASAVPSSHRSGSFVAERQQSAAYPAALGTPGRRTDGGVPVQASGLHPRMATSPSRAYSVTGAVVAPAACPVSHGGSGRFVPSSPAYGSCRSPQVPSRCVRQVSGPARQTKAMAMPFQASQISGA
eukprot:TRINITY_DN12323_c0_g1_i2.p1 TRINITY_DN12323_c0_g1~~TRINITY_DN12323_c0_g1_i2.p1  ORF type:complete len:435 (+),score=94.10 TRINITY_DN12323_c0_g1_i2:43-1347(+)